MGRVYRVQYRTIKVGAGCVAGVGVIIYSVWAIIATVDGRHHGIEIPTDVAIPLMTLIGLLAATSILLYLAERVEQRVVQSLISDGFALIVSGVDAKLKANNRQVQHMIATTVKAEVAAALEDVSSRAVRAALIKQASDMAAAAASADVDASVTSITGRR